MARLRGGVALRAGVRLVGECQASVFVIQLVGKGSNRDRNAGRGLHNLAAVTWLHPGPAHRAFCIPEPWKRSRPNRPKPELRQLVPLNVASTTTTFFSVVVFRRRPFCLIRHREDLAHCCGSKQSTAGVTVTSEENGSANSRREPKFQYCGGSPPSRSRPDIQNLDFSGGRQTATTTLRDHVRLDEIRRVVALLEISRSDVRCLANPETCRAEQGITVMHGFGHQTVESTRGPALRSVSRRTTSSKKRR